MTDAVSQLSQPCQQVLQFITPHLLRLLDHMSSHEHHMTDHVTSPEPFSPVETISEGNPGSPEHRERGRDDLVPVPE